MIRRYVTQLLLVTALCVTAAAQYTTITGQVLDPVATPYANGSLELSVVLGSGCTTGTLLSGTGKNFQTSYVTALDANGNIQSGLKVADNNFMCPNSQWKITGCDSTKTVCFSGNVTITGTSQSLTSSIQAISTLISTATIGPSGSVLCPFCVTNTVNAFLVATPIANAVTTADRVTGGSNFYIDPSAANPGRRVFLRTSAGNLAASDSAIVEQWNMAAPGGASSTFSYNSNSHTQNNTGNQDCTPNCKTYSPGEVHLMGTISKSIDTNNGGVTLYGTEARVDSLGSNSAAGANHKGQRYIGGVMVATWSAAGSGGNFGAQLHGEESLTQIVTDNTFTTGVNTGLRAGFVNRPGLGGDPNARIGFLEQDTGNTSYIRGLSAPGLNTVTQWLPSTVYALNALVWPTLAPTGLLYRQTTVGGCTSFTEEPGTKTQGSNEWPFSSGGTITEPANGGNQCLWTEVRLRSEAFGKGANSGSATGFDTAVGDGATATGGASTSLGATANCTHANSTCLGTLATDTASNQVVIGAPASPSLHYFFGKGVTSVSPVLVDFNGTGGSGTNIVGGSISVGPGAPTGNAAGTQYSINRALMGASGSTAQTMQNAVTVCESKTLSNTSATTTSLATVALPSNSAGGVDGSITVTCSDGTNFDSETQHFDQSYVNKAGAFTFGTAAITTSTAANNSGSCTIGATFTSGSSLININVTPVYTTIVPTTVTAFIEIHNHGTGAVACQ